MKSIKILAILGLVISFISFISLKAFNNVIEYEAAIGWGIITVFYLIAVCVVALTTIKEK